MAAITIVGAGAYGRAFAQRAQANGHDVTLVSRRAHADLEGDGIRVCSAAEGFTEIELREVSLLAVPPEYVERCLVELAPRIGPSHRIVHISRHLVGEDLRPTGQLIQSHTACRQVAVIAGPITPEALLRDAPLAAVIGCEIPAFADELRQFFGGQSLRFELEPSCEGVEWASALSGLLLFVLGMIDAELGGDSPTALAGAACRGLREMQAICRALGVSDAACTGLAGVGDLMASLAGVPRREFELGRVQRERAASGGGIALTGDNLEAGQPQADALLRLARRLTQRAGQIGLSASFFSAVQELLGDAGASARVMSALVASTGTWPRV